MKFTIYCADCVGEKTNTLYPHEAVIINAEELQEAVKRDTVCALYKGNYRGNDNFIRSDVIPMDCDNDHSDNPNDWITPEKVDEYLPQIGYAIAPSRHNNIPKNGKTARPKFHIYFFVNEITDAEEYAAIKRGIHKAYPFFDSKAMDAARFFFGSDNGPTIWHEGEFSITEMITPEEAEYSGGGTIPTGCRNSTLSRFAAKVLKRYGVTDEALRLFLTENEKCDPPIEDHELKTIWNSAVKFYKKKVVTQEGYVPPKEYNDDPLKAKEGNPVSEEWDDPIPLAGGELPEFPVDALPLALRDYALAVAESTQTAVDMAAVGALTVVSACMRNLYKVEGKPDWHEPTNIYSVIIAAPSERKSANIVLNKKPIDEFVHEYNEAHKVDFEISRATKQRLENKKNSLLSASKKKGSDDSAEDFNDALRDVVEQLVQFEEKKPMRVYVDDTTPEKLVETLAGNNNAISIISSEGGIFDVLSGTYSSKVNIDVFLKAYSGEHISVDRIMRSSVTVEEACLTILLSVQPVVIGDLMKNKRFRHRGLTARFLYTHPRSMVGDRSLNSRPIPPEVYLEYKRVIYNILSEERSQRPEIIKLTSDARKLLDEYYNWTERMLAGEFSFYGDWIGKLVGNTLRIAGIMARASVMKKNVGDAFLETDNPILITGEILGNAIRIGKYFLSHSISAYSTMGVYSDCESLSKVLEKIIATNIREISRRDLMRLCRWISSADEANNVLMSLEDYGYLRLIAIDSSDKLRGGRPKNPTYAVNPKIF